MRIFVAALLTVVLFPFPALVAEDKKEDIDRFQGTWAVVKLEQAGEDLAELVKEESPTMTFDGKKYTFTLGEAVEKGEFKLDPKAKTPTIDYDIQEGEQKGKKQVGIYKFDGDTLILSLAQEGAEVRPTKFQTAADAPEFVMFTLKRKKKD